MIGVPRYWRSTTLPAGHVWANGDLALFADWPELKKIYDAGGFAGMLLAYNANSATIAANLGKWRPNAANPTGLYVPNLSEQFFRAWTGTGEAGSWQADTGRELTGDQTFTAAAEGWLAMGFGVFGASTLEFDTMAITGGTSSPTGAYSFRASRVWGEHTGVEFAPVHIWQPCIVYLGNSA